MWWSEGDTRCEHIFVVWILIDSWPVTRFPFLKRLTAIICVHFHKAVWSEYLVGDVVAFFVVGFEAHTGKWRDEHRKIESLFPFASIEKFVLEFAFLDLFDMGSRDPVYASFGEE